MSGDDWMRNSAAWRRRRRPLLVLPTLVGAIQIVGTNVAAGSQPASRPLDALAYALLIAGPVALVARRTWPLPAFVIADGATMAFLALGYPRGPFFLAGLVALFSAARRAPRPAVWSIAGAGYAGYVAASLAWGTFAAGTAAAVGAWSAVAVALAEAARIRSEHFAEMGRSMAQAQRAKEEAERARLEQARRQTSDERLRIAQELHDVLGHHLSLINVRAGVALHLLDSQPEQTREALAAIKQASAEALREVRGVLAALRPADESAPRTPSPGLAQVELLGDDLDLTVVREGEVTPLPPEVDRAAYRIVQESLTNVRRHAGPGAQVTVTLGYARTMLILRVDDTGTGAEQSTSDGNGIPGMRERAAAIGGRLSAGPGPERGFRVDASLPVRS